MLWLNSIQCELFSLSFWIFLLFLFVECWPNRFTDRIVSHVFDWAHGNRLEPKGRSQLYLQLLSSAQIELSSTQRELSWTQSEFDSKDTFCRYRLFLQVIKMLFLIAFFAKCERRIRLNVSALKYWFWTWCLQLEIILWWYFCRQLLLLTKYGLVKWALVISFFSSFPVLPKYVLAL